MDSLINFVTNKTFITLFLAVVISQGIKTLEYLLKHRKFEWRMLIENGGFPSTHSAAVSALALSVFFVEGFSLLFIVCLVFSGIIIRDAFGVRQDVQKHAIILEKITKKKINEHVGHNSWQVFAGIFLGFIIASTIHLIL
jgi:uncharacterized protein